MASLVPLHRPLSGPALAETLDGGQCFRWRLGEDGAWRGVSGRLAVDLRANAPSGLSAEFHAGTVDDLRHHLADDVDWHALADTLPWRTDAHLARCIAAFPGLRILRQPIGEALLCFLCSATKQIVQIKQMVALLAARHGHLLAHVSVDCRNDPNARAPGAPAGRPRARATCHPTGDTPARPAPSQCHPLGDTGGGRARADCQPIDDNDRSAGAGECQLLDDKGRAAARGAGEVSRGAEDVVHALPTWEQLARVPEKALRECLLGFRARHVAGVAAFLAERPGWLEATAELPYEQAKVRLLQLPGVGEKIADCVLLFGAGRLKAFPVDVWILRVMEQRYGLHGWNASQLAQFGRTHFGPLAGLAQQYLFAWERRCAATDHGGK